MTINSYPRKRIGGPHRSVRVKAQPIEVETDPEVLADPVGKAMLEEIEAGIAAINKPVAESTAKRKGRRGTRLFNNTGKLASKLRIEKGQDGKLAILPPSDRLTGATRELIGRLVELVPVLKDPRKLMQSRRVRKAQDAVMAGMIRVKRR